jgi:hypothetical protein
MSMRTKYQEIEDELGVLHEEVRSIGTKQDNIQEQIDAVHVRLEKVDVIKAKMDKVEGLLVKNDQVLADIFTYLKRLEGKITCPPTPDPDSPGLSVLIREQEILLKQHELAQEIQNRSRMLDDLQLPVKPPAPLQLANTAQPVLHTHQHNSSALALPLPEKNSQYKSEKASQFLKTIAKGPKIDFPYFSGEKPLGWIRQVNKYFELSQVPDECKVDLSQTYITGHANNWLRSSRVLTDTVTWEQFCRLLCDRFAESSIYEILERFHGVKQLNLSVSAYTDKFEEIMAIIRDEHPYLQDHYYIVSFVNGLKP